MSGFPKYMSYNELDNNFEIWEIEEIECWLVHKEDSIYNLLKKAGFEISETDYKKIPFDKWSDRVVIYHDEPYRPQYNFYEEVHKVLNNGEKLPYMLSTTEY